MNRHVTSLRLAGVVLLAWVLAGVSPDSSGTAIEIGVAGRANANASIATAGSFVGVAWAARTTEGVTDIFAATRRDEGRSFRPPVRVNQVAGEASVSGEQPPRIGVVSNAAGEPSVVVMWTAKSPSGTRLVSARSNDGGRSFGPAQAVPGSDASGNRGWESMAINAKGDPVVMWLDHREVPPRPAGTGPGGAHQHGASGQHRGDGAARAQRSQIFFASLNDPASARAVAPGVCYCCKTAVATGADGSVVAAWRHVYPGNVRDIALTKSLDGGRTFAPPVRVSDDNWVLDGCPENGPAVALDRMNGIHVVWSTLVQGAAGDEPTLALFYATSRDGQRFTKRQELSTDGVPRHPQIVIGPRGEMTIAWDESANGQRRIAVARGTIDSGNPARLTRASIPDGAGAYPAVASLTDGAIIAWTSGPAESSMLRIVREPRGAAASQ